MEENPLSAFFRKLERVVVRASETARELKDSVVADVADKPPSRNAARILALRNISSESSQMRVIKSRDIVHLDRKRHLRFAGDAAACIGRGKRDGTRSRRIDRHSRRIVPGETRRRRVARSQTRPIRIQRQDEFVAYACRFDDNFFLSVAMETSKSSTPSAAAAAAAAPASVDEATRQSLTPQLQGISKATRRQLKEQAEMRGTAIVATPRRDGDFPLRLETPKSTAIGYCSTIPIVFIFLFFGRFDSSFLQNKVCEGDDGE